MCIFVVRKADWQPTDRVRIAEMNSQIQLDQFLLDISYSREDGDHYNAGWIDLDVVAGKIELEDSLEMVDMTEDDCYRVQRQFGKQIERKLIEENL